MDVDQTDGLCEKCRQPFTDWAHVVETCKGGSESIYSHHNLSTLKDSVTEGCTMCLMFLNEVSRQISSFTPEARRVINTLHGQLTIHPNRTTFKFDIAQVRSWNVGLKFVPPRLSVLAMLTLTPTDQKDQQLALGASTMSPASFRLISHWLECCNATHQKCTVPNYAMPTRLIEIDASDVRICYSEQLPTPPHYVTLSHCWGGLKLFNLTKDNLRSMQDKIPQQKLCLTFRHAIGITRLLGFKYLWIDSLCIVQDDELDWRQEAAKMGSVYGCSSLNIAAASATNGSFGCFYNRKEQVLRCVRGVRVRVDGALHIVHEESSYYRSSITSSPLATRSWVLQERVLAPRVIWFSEQQLFWECRESLACETFQVQLPDFYGQYQPSNRGIDTLSKRWPSLVTKYTTGKLTRDSDKLVAISGLAQKAQQETGDDYVWGLWRRDLEAQLCWTLKDKSKGSYAGPLQSRAPSWSWASVNGPINLPIGIGWSASQIYGKILIRVVNVTTAPIANFPLEDGESKTLRLVCGPLFSAREVSGPEERDPQVLLAETLIRVSWIGYWDVPSDKSEEPRDPFYCLPIMRSETMVAAYDNRCEGLILKKTDNGMRGQFKRLGTYRVSGSSDAVRAMEDPKSMMQESMWESYGGLDTLGRRQYTITLL